MSHLEERLEHDINKIRTQVADQSKEVIRAVKDAVHDLMSLDDPPTAIFSVSEVRAGHAIQALIGLGISIPEDVSVTGIGGLDIYAHLSPAMSTVDLRFRQIGAEAIAVLDVLFASLEEERAAF